MPRVGTSPERLSAVELKEELVAAGRGVPFLAYRTEEGVRHLCPLPESGGRLTLGRSPACDLCVDGDAEVSGVHAELERLGDYWVISDDGLSRNGTFVNGDRIRGRRRLRDRDAIRGGRTVLIFRDPAGAAQSGTVVPRVAPEPPPVSPAQRRVLVALCRPVVERGAFATPATNAEIAAELVVSVEAVRTHLRALFERFGVEHLPQNRKRLRLVELALETGVVRPGALETTR